MPCRHGMPAAGNAAASRPRCRQQQCLMHGISRAPPCGSPRALAWGEQAAAAACTAPHTAPTHLLHAGPLPTAAAFQAVGRQGGGGGGGGPQSRAGDGPPPPRPPPASSGGGVAAACRFTPYSQARHPGVLGEPRRSLMDVTDIVESRRTPPQPTTTHLPTQTRLHAHATVAVKHAFNQASPLHFTGSNTSSTCPQLHDIPNRSPCMQPTAHVTSGAFQVFTPLWHESRSEGESVARMGGKRGKKRGEAPAGQAGTKLPSRTLRPPAAPLSYFPPSASAASAASRARR
jgi:hypothetical protein